MTGLEEGTAYQARVRARYHNSGGKVEHSGPWSDAAEITISATPSQDGEGDSNEGPSTKPAGLITAASHDSVLLSWDIPGDDSITGYQVLRGPDADSLDVLTDDTGSATSSYTDDTVEAETTYVYAVRGRNTHGLSPQSDAVSVTTPAAPPAKPTGLLTAASHDNVLLSWDNPDDDSITGYQVLRGEDADNLAVLTDDTGSTSASYTDSTVEAEMTYVYAVRGRNARGLGPQSDPVTLTTSAAPEEDDPPTSARALAGEDFTLAGQDLDTGDSNCLEDTIGDVTADCTINIDTTTAIFAVDGTLDSDDRLNIKIGRDKAAVDAASNAVDQDDLVGADAEATLTFQVGRNLMRLWGDEDGTSGGSEVHFYRVNVLPYWELNGDRLSKSDDCRTGSDRTAAQITDDDCIVTQYGSDATIQFHNVIAAQYFVEVWVNGALVIEDPDDTALGSSFPLELLDGSNVNVVRVRLVRKANSELVVAEIFMGHSFYYKVETNVLVSNLGQPRGTDITIDDGLLGAASPFTTGSETRGYYISQVRLNLAVDSGTIAKVSIYSDRSGRPGSVLKVLYNPDSVPFSMMELGFGADNYKLEPSTPYWIVVERSAGTGSVRTDSTSSTAEDANAAAGWSIGDNGSGRQTDGAWANYVGTIVIPRIAIKGSVYDATLSALALKDASDNAVALAPAFASGTTSYNAMVANSISRIKVEPTTSDSNASITYLDRSGVALADADTDTTVFDFALNTGRNVVKVKVSAQDGATIRTYTVTVTRQAADDPSADATLSALALTDASNNAVALTPTFASGATSYKARVVTTVSQIKVQPTANDSNATIEYLDGSDATLPDADTNTAVFDFILAEGENVVKVKVTAEDETTTKTYTVTVTRDSATAATGAPTITGTARVNETLTAETTNIRDVDGLTGASFSYQWIRVDTDGSESDIAGAVSSTYVLTGDDEGKRLKVRASFDDDNSNPESLTSAATAAVSPSPCTVEGELRFNGSLSAIDVVIGDSAGTTVTLPSWSGPVCRALFYLGYSNSEDVDVFRGDGHPSITSVTFDGREFSVDQETRELTIRTTSDLPPPWNSTIEFWDTLETYMLVPLDNWGATEQSQFQGQDIFVRFHNLAAPNLFFSRDGRTVRFSGGTDYSTDLYPGRPFNAGGYEIQRCDTSAGCTSDSNWTRVVQTANGQGTDWSLNRTDNVPSASSDYRYRARQHITLRHDGSTYYGPWSSEVLLRTE